MTIQELYETAGGSYESAKRVMQLDRLIEKFILKYADDTSFERFQNAWAARDAEGAFEGAHALKGVCANLGLDELSARASELAEEFRPGHTRALSDEEVQRRAGELRALHEKAVSAIRAYAQAKAD
ncbi:MAG: Hpt domain-containing protein [Oscillospiraceae bacterium]|nr:Hpt domain-containing protein [Oscillospiraceae bacterium]